MEEVESKVNGVERHLFEKINEESSSLLVLITNIDASIPIILENMPEYEEDNPQDLHRSIITNTDASKRNMSHFSKSTVFN